MVKIAHSVLGGSPSFIRLNAVALALCILVVGCAALPTSTPTPAASSDRRSATYANPIDLPYRYQPSSNAPYREAADPTMIRFQGRYWLFPSHSQGYWWSLDLLHWTFIEGRGYDVRRYAPTVVEMNGRLYLAASEHAPKIWTTTDPMSGIWTEAADVRPGFQDPDLFLDDDHRLYMYEGISGTDVLRAFELDPSTFERLHQSSIAQSRDKQTRGWEVVGDHNEQLMRPSYIEGSWVTKHNGRYYLQYAAPGTEFATYADGVLVADNPMGPFVYQNYSPFSVKPTGFITGAGHSSTFQGADGRWWHVSTMRISRRFMFERRLGLFPTMFTRSGELIADTYLGDYPHYINGDRGLTGWMLLSRKHSVTVSSTLPGFPAENAVDENVQSWWSAQSGSADEWYQVDLGADKTIQAVQINFADQDSGGQGAGTELYNYVLEVSNDGIAWRSVVDHSTEGRDAPHDYEVLSRPERARFVRLRNVHAPDGGKFSLYDLRVFGTGDGNAPSVVAPPQIERDRVDARRARITWAAASGAEFYIVRFGVRQDIMNQNYQVYDGATVLDVASLNVGAPYCFAIDAVNENGVTRSRSVRCIR